MTMGEITGLVKIAKKITKNCNSVAILKWPCSPYRPDSYRGELQNLKSKSATEGLHGPQ